MDAHEYAIRGSEKNLITIEIPLDEYKELLIVKGRYEELKSQKYQTIDWKPNTVREPLTIPTITYTEPKDPLPGETYKITC